MKIFQFERSEMEPLHPDLRRVAADDHVAALRRAAAAPVMRARRARPRQRLGRALVQAGLRLAPDALPALVR